MSSKTSGLFPRTVGVLDQLQANGVLPSQLICELVDRNHIYSKDSIDLGQVQPASMDLRVGSTAHRVRASFLPGRDSPVEKKIHDLMVSKVDLTQGIVFEPGAVFIVPLMEGLALPENIAAKANPKSTTGRLDIFVRLITDFGEEFERVRPGYKGMLYAEIVSRTFPIVVRKGMKLNQIRFIRGKEKYSDSKLTNLHRKEQLVYTDEDTAAEASIYQGLRISLDLKGSGPTDAVAYKARHNAPAVDLDKVNYYDYAEFWERIASRGDKGIILDPGDFYLMVSKEKVRVPPSWAAEMVPFDPSLGEFRVHYAGFFDPGFGYGTSDILGTKAVLEVRAHEVPILVEDGQTVCRLIYTEMMEQPSKIYGSAIGSSYQQQGLALSKQFKRDK